MRATSSRRWSVIKSIGRIFPSAATGRRGDLLCCFLPEASWNGKRPAGLPAHPFSGCLPVRGGQWRWIPEKPAGFTAAGTASALDGMVRTEFPFETIGRCAESSPVFHRGKYRTFSGIFRVPSLNKWGGAGAKRSERPAKPSLSAGNIPLTQNTFFFNIHLNSG